MKKRGRPKTKEYRRSTFTLEIFTFAKLREMSHQESVSMTGLIERLINQYWENKKAPSVMPGA